MSSSLDHKCQRCGSQYQGQVCPFCTITGLDVNALLASEGLALHQEVESSPVQLVDVVSNRVWPVNVPLCRFGRDVSNDIVLSGDKSLSRFHFQITFLDNEYFVEDAGSRNGTFLNGSPVTAPRKLLNGDIVSAGMSRYRFVVKAEEEAAGGEFRAPEAEGEAAPGQASVPNAPTAEVNTNFAPPGPQGESVDPLAKIFEEGQALLSKAQTDESELDALWSGSGDNGKEAAPAATGERSVDDAFSALEAAQAQTMPPNGTGAAPAKEAEPAAAPAKTQAAPAKAPEPAKGAKTWPAWCSEYSFEEVNSIKDKIRGIQEIINKHQAEIAELETSLQAADSIKNQLLASRNGDLIQACMSAFESLGWSIQTLENKELVLMNDSKAEALVKIVSTESEPQPAELANLVSAQTNYWSEHKIEPKGVLLVAWIQDGPPTQRHDCSQDFSDYAARKNFCVMNTLQLLAMYRDATLGNKSKDEIRANVLNANGQLSGYDIELSKA
jgi:hypothetical protein